LKSLLYFYRSPTNDGSSDGSSDGTRTSESSSSEGEDEVEPPPPIQETTKEEIDPDQDNKSWKLSIFLSNPKIQKSPIEAPSPIEQADNMKGDDNDEEEEGELRRSSDDYPNNNSNSSTGDNDKSDEEEQIRRHPMLPPSKVKSTPDTPTQRTPDTKILNTALQILNDPNIIQPLSSISDSDDNASKNVSQKPKKKRPKKLPRLPKAENSSSDETRQRLAEEKRLLNSRGRPSKNSVPDVCLTPKQDAAQLPKTKKTQRRKGARRPESAISRPTLSTSDSSSDDDDKETSSIIKKPSRKKPKSPEKQQPIQQQQQIKQQQESSIETSSDDDAAHNARSPSRSPDQVPRRPFDHSDSESNHSSAEHEKIKNKTKINVLSRIYSNPKSGSEGGKGGKGGKGKGGQVVVITQEDVQNQSQKDASANVQNHHPKFMSPTSAFINNTNSSAIPSNLSFRVSIPLKDIDVWRVGISEEKLKAAGHRPTKSPKKRKISTDSWRTKKNNNHDQQQQQLSESDSSNEQSMENPATRPTTYTTPNYNNDRLNNNVDHKSKDINNYYSNSPNSVGDTKLPRIKPEPVSKSDFRKEKIKNKVMVKQEVEDKPRDRSSSMNSTHSSYNKKKRKRIDESNSLMPPTNHERMQNGDLTPNSMMNNTSVKPEIKKVYFSYFERNEELDPNEFG
jgi:hypothetical protein